MGGDAQDSYPSGVVMVALGTLCDACRNHERNRDAFIYTNMAQLTSLLLRWTYAADADGHHDGGKDQAPVDVATSLPNTRLPRPAAAAAAAEETAGLVTAGLKLVRTVCTKTENNK
ncbi:unnamed protein product, partial [Laminaria digitata]